jgi:serine/threonine-protein kinase HipA
VAGRPVADGLVAWLHGTPVAVLRRAPEFRIRLEWHQDGIARWGLGSPVLSVGLPIGTPTGPRNTRGLDFFENMLPEGPALARMATLAGVRPVDTYGILTAFGRDCAGAVMLLPDGEQPGPADRGGYTPVTLAGLRQVISDLDVAPLGAAPERGFRPSLAGFQRKALLGRAADGTWQLPYGDAPSTWILKPDGPHSMAANEATCLRLAAACGLDAAETELLDVAGLPVLAVRRYDRLQPPAGSRPQDGTLPARVHQEDGCQATATPPGMKYQEQGGPALRDFAGLLRNYADPADVIRLLRRTAFNMAVGNADAHAKNFSVLHDADNPVISLAPLYDVLATIALELTGSAGQPLQADTHLGQWVGGQADIRKVTATSLMDEAATWGIRRRTAGAVVADTLDRVIAATAETPGDERVLAVIRKQAEQVRRRGE